MSFLLHLWKAEVTHAARWLRLVMGQGLNFQGDLNHMPDFAVLLCVLSLSQLSLTVHPLGRISPEPSRGLFSTKEKAASPWRLSQNWPCDTCATLSWSRQVLKRVQLERREQWTPPLDAGAPCSAGRGRTVGSHLGY